MGAIYLFADCLPNETISAIHALGANYRYGDDDDDDDDDDVDDANDADDVG